jgi:hypothetical protein
MRFFLALLALCVCLRASAQNHTISGYISDAKTGERLIGANIYEPSLRIGATTNTYGFYSFSFATSDSIRLLISYVGYQSIILRLAPRQDENLNINLQPSVTLGEVLITASRSEQIQDRTQMSRIDLPMEKLKSIPMFMGETDILKAIQLLPGVQGGGEGGSGLYVRGGGPDQNLILLDGAPVYNVSHLFGFFSVFNADAIKNVSLYTGGFPARYGGRLSSVIDITMKEGNLKKISGSAGIGLVASRLVLEGPIKKDKGSFIVSARRTYLDVLLSPLIKLASEGTGTAGYYFWDVNAKANYLITNKDRVYLSFYGGRDRFYARTNSDYSDSGIEYTQRDNYGIEWGNYTSTLRWNHQFNNKLFANTSLIFSDFRFVVDATLNETTDDGFTKTSNSYRLKYLSGIKDRSAKIDFDYYAGNKHLVRFGAGFIDHTFTTGTVQFNLSEGNIVNYDTTFGSKPIYAHEFYAYLEDDWQITSLLKINPGLRWSGNLVQGTWFQMPEPRISARYLLNETSSIKASFVMMQQYLHLLTNSTVGLPTDLWVPATARIKPQRSWQPALGYSRSFKKYSQNFEFTAEVYYKHMNNVIDYLGGANFLNTAESWENKVDAGRGWAYGLELFLQKKTGRWNGWIGYTISYSRRQFPNINFGDVFPYKYDRRHDVELVLERKMNDQFSLGITWVFGTGNAITLPIGQFNVPNNPLSLANGIDFMGSGGAEYFGSRNSFRMIPYHRLDIGFNWFGEKKKRKDQLNVSLYNAYSRLNPYFYYVGYSQSGDKEVRSVALFPIIPSISYNINF